MQNFGVKQGVLWEMSKWRIEFWLLTYVAFFKMDIIDYWWIFISSEENKQNTSAGIKTLVYSENCQAASINKSEYSKACACAPSFAINTTIIIRRKASRKLACVASVSARVRREKLRREPSRSNFRAITRLETLATQATRKTGCFHT